MSLEKPINKLKILILFTAYKRFEYTRRSIKAIEDAQKYGPNVTFILINDGSPGKETSKILEGCKLNKRVINHKENIGLRNRTIDFFDIVRKDNPDFICKLDNDVMVPKNWLNDMLEVFRTTDVDILSANCNPSNPAYTIGIDDVENKGYRPSHTVGQWLMKKEMIDDVCFERTSLRGIWGSIHIMYQIVYEKKPNIGFTTKVVCENLGHNTGKHPEAIKTDEYRKYYKESGRHVTW